MMLEAQDVYERHRIGGVAVVDDAVVDGCLDVAVVVDDFVDVVV